MGAGRGILWAAGYKGRVTHAHFGGKRKRKGGGDLTKSTPAKNIGSKWALNYGGKSPKPKARTTPVVKTTFSKISVRLNAFLIRHVPGRVGEYVVRRDRARWPRVGGWAYSPRRGRRAWWAPGDAGTAAQSN